MDAARWRRVEELFHQMEGLPAELRAQALGELCAGDTELQADVESLLSAAETDILEPAVQAAAHEALASAPAGTIGNYRIVRLLGEGGMGMVFEAEQQSPRRNVALKLIRAGRYASPRMRRMFERESEALGRLRHPGIATIFESGVAGDGQPFLAMELAPGQPLDAWLKQQDPLPALGKHEAARRLRIFAAVCEAVAYAHQNGVIHRDLKPSNIFVSGGEAVKILDFGLARMMDAAAREIEQTEAGVVQGSVPYMSPEQARGETDRIDTRSDVYSLGVIFYWLLTAHHPYLEGPVGLVEGFQAVCTKAPAPFRQHYGRFDADLETIAGKALEKEPAQRYQTVAALLGDIESYLADLPIAARPPSFVYLTLKLMQRHRAGFAATAAIALLLVAFTVITLIQSARLRTERDRANQEAATARQVSNFLVDLFRNTDPTKQPGADLSARELLRAGRQRLDKDLQTQPSLRARLLDQIGHAYNELGPFSEARDAFEESLAIRRKLYGSGAVELAEAHSGLNVAFHALGDFKQAIQAEREALRLLERRAAGASTQPLAASLGRLAVSLAAQGELAEAERTARRAVELDREAGRSGKVEGLHRLESLGSVLRLKEDYAAAIPVLREAARGIERAEGETAAGGCINELGIALNRVGQEKEAEQVFRRLDAIVAKGWGETNLNRAPVKSNLAFSLLAQKRFGEAEAAARDSLAVYEKNGGDNPRRADVHNVLAQIAEAQGRLDRALAEWRTAYRIALAGFGAEQYRTRMVAVQLGRLLALTGSPAEGLALIRGNIEALRSGRKDTLDWAVIQRLYGETLQAAGQSDQARRVLDDSLRLLLARAGPDHPEVRRTRLALGLAIEQPAKDSPGK